MNEKFSNHLPENWPGRFRGRGHRVTIPRRIILQILSNAEKHLSAEEIYLRSYKLYPAIGLTTVYRTLDFLMKNGLVMKVESGEGRARYELVGKIEGVNCHQHLVCINCRSFFDTNELTEEEQDIIKKMKEKISRKYGFSIKNCILHFYGECKDCRKKE
ncbi:MAG: Fur family transcriptional regulator [Atribacterota bacterium]|nr:Fur family transcriptional regulator [Atribacterota bacterium]